MKAMAKRREDRYTTAQDFADDLRRVLEGKPTAARPPTVAERLGKWARRHHGAVVAAAAVCVFAVLGMTASTLLITREKIKAEQNYARAEKHFREAQEAVDRFGVQLAERLADVPGADQVRKELLQQTLQYYCDFVEQAKENPALRADLALTYSKIGTSAPRSARATKRSRPTQTRSGSSSNWPRTSRAAGLPPPAGRLVEQPGARAQPVRPDRRRPPRVSRCHPPATATRGRFRG